MTKKRTAHCESLNNIGGVFRDELKINELESRAMAALVCKDLLFC